AATPARSTRPAERRTTAHVTSPTRIVLGLVVATIVSTARLQVPWRAVATGVWLAGSVAWFGAAGFKAFRFRRLLAHAAPAPAEVRAEAETLCERLALGACPEVVVVPFAVSPLLWAMG